MHPESNISYLHQCYLWGSAVWLFIKLFFKSERVTSNFCFFLRVSSCQLSKFGKSIFTRFWGVLCQPVHPESNISQFHQFSVLDSALLSFIKTRHRLRKSILKIIFAPSLRFLTLSPANLVNVADFGTYATKQCTQNQI